MIKIRRGEKALERHRRGLHGYDTHVGEERFLRANIDTDLRTCIALSSKSNMAVACPSVQVLVQLAAMALYHASCMQ